MQFSVRSPLRGLVSRAKSTAAKVAKAKREILEVIGTQLLSLSMQDYRTKSRGGTGTDGITWRKLAASTIKRKGRRGKVNEKRKTTKGGKPRPGAGSSAIGIDTGLQQSSASPGFKGPDGEGGNVLENDGTAVTVGYGREYSKHFDKDRPLLPETLPPQWEAKCEKQVSKIVEKIIRDELL